MIIFLLYNRRALPWTFNLANSLVLKRIHARIGLDCVKITLSGAAPIHRGTIEYFMGINMPVLELYGMSESSGPQTLNMINNWRLGSVGHSIKGTHLKIDQPDENGEGEVSILADFSPSFFGALRVAVIPNVYVLVDLYERSSRVHGLSKQ
jgi:long-chain-fatty-acid--CoA ligase ACSBG